MKCSLLTLLAFLCLGSCSEKNAKPVHMNNKVLLAFHNLSSYRPIGIVKWLLVDVESQSMHLINRNTIIASYSISTSKGGASIYAALETNKTPLGTFRITDKIGAGAPSETIFSNGLPVGLLSDYKGKQRDLVLTRILILDGCEPSINKGYNRLGMLVDTKRRKVYIHGTNEESRIGMPASHGCVRMRRQDIIELFDEISTNTLVYIM